MTDDTKGELCLFQLAPGASLPPPNRLKRKILIKNKRLRPEVEKEELELFRKGLLADMEEEEKEDASAPLQTNAAVAAAVANTNGAGENGGGGGGSGATNGNGRSTPTNANASNNAAAASSTAAAVPAHPQSTPYQGSTLNVHPFLSSMVVYTQPMKFQGFDFSEQENASYKMSSFPETTALGYLKTQAIEFVNYNKRQLSRIYPKGSRVDSSNFMPQVGLEKHNILKSTFIIRFSIPLINKYVT